MSNVTPFPAMHSVRLGEPEPLHTRRTTHGRWRATTVDARATDMNSGYSALAPPRTPTYTHRRCAVLIRHEAGTLSRPLPGHSIGLAHSDEIYREEEVVFGPTRLVLSTELLSHPS